MRRLLAWIDKRIDSFGYRWSKSIVPMPSWLWRVYWDRYIAPQIGSWPDES